VALTAAPTSPFDRFWALLFPTRCLGCARRGHDVCPSCREAIPWLGPEVCPRCTQASPLGRLCSRCRNSPSALDGIRAACSFEGIVRKAVHELKYRYARSRAPFLADLIHRAVERRPLRADLLVPVPLWDARRRERGFNQAELIAGALAERAGIPCSTGVLRRIRETPPQVGLNAGQRRTNVAGAFACVAADGIGDKFVLVIDDVATTGATLLACAEPLKAAGARRVVGLVAGRGA
jgi:ComF family protein